MVPVVSAADRPPVPRRCWPAAPRQRRRAASAFPGPCRRLRARRAASTPTIRPRSCPPRVAPVGQGRATGGRRGRTRPETGLVVQPTDGRQPRRLTRGPPTAPGSPAWATGPGDPGHTQPPRHPGSGDAVQDPGATAVIRTGDAPTGVASGAPTRRTAPRRDGRVFRVSRRRPRTSAFRASRRRSGTSVFRVSRRRPRRPPPIPTPRSARFR